jgi:5'-nucleotidase/UDP-sugar diphosphatase
VSRATLSRRELLTGSAAVGATIVLSGDLAAAADGKKTFTILHTNDMHSAFIGMGPASDYSPFLKSAACPRRRSAGDAEL